MADFKNPDLRKAMDSLVASLSGSGASEATRKVDSVLEQVSTVSDDLTTALSSVRRQAALRGYFDPRALVRSLPSTVATQVLSKLHPQSSVQTRAGERVWLLDREPRREVLQEIAAEPGGLEHAARNTRLPRDDKLGRELRELLRGKAPNVDRVKPERLNRLLQVSEWVEDIISDAPSPGRVRREASSRALDQDLRAMLRYGLLGRAEQLRQLKAFASEPPGDKLKILPITGVGGSGKSTLLAKFALDLRRDKDVIAVYLDFDRPDLAAGDANSLLIEFVRQLAQAIPELAEPLRELGRQARETEMFGQYGNLESTIRGASGLVYDLGVNLRGAGASERPIVMLLDTFEQLVACGGPAVEGMRYLLGALFSEAGLRGLRVVASGRVIDDDIAESDWELREPMVLGDLPRRFARQLLAGRGITRRDDADAVVTTFGGNPLVLCLIAQLLNGSNLSVADLTDASGEWSEETDKQLVQGLLYRRFLRHIRDGEVRRIAHPGLVLRRVTPRILGQVLAPLTGLGTLDDDAARDLFGRLMREAWLVQSVGPDEVQHRRELRAIMLRLMRLDLSEREKAGEIHQGAISFYAGGGHPGLSDAERDAEILYHRLMLGEPATLAALDRRTVDAHRAVLVEDLDGFAPAVAATLRYLLDEPLSREAARLLPEPWRAEYIDTRGRELAGQERQDEALELAADLDEPVPDQGGGSTRDPAEVAVWELQAAHDAARWRSNASWIHDVAAVQDDRPRERFEKAADDGEDRWLDRQLILSLLLLRLGNLDSARWHAIYVINAFEKQLESANIDEQTRAAVLRAANYQSLAECALGGSGQQSRRGWFDQISHEERIHSEALSLEYTRSLELDINHGAGRSRELSLAQLRLVPSWEWLDLIDRIAGSFGAAEQFNEFRRGLEEQLAPERRAPSSGVLLGRVSQQFRDTVSSIQLTVGELANLLVDPKDLIHSENPELRAPVRHVLASSFNAYEARVALAEQAWDLFAIRPSDLHPEAFWHRSKGDARHRFAALVEYADRCGLLMALLDGARRLAPDDEQVATVVEAAEQWNQSLGRAPSLPA